MEDEVLELEENLYSIYIETDKEKRVTKIFSNLFEAPTETSILIEKGTGDRFAHAHLYLDKSIYDGVSYNYKYEDGHIIERTEEEKKSDVVITEPVPTPIEKAEARITELEKELLATNVYVTDVEIASVEAQTKAQTLELELQKTNQYMTDLELLVLENITKTI